MNIGNPPGSVRRVELRYMSVTEGLTPSEREVEVRFGSDTYWVLVHNGTLNITSGTLAVHLMDDPEDEKAYLVDLGGEALNSPRRVKVAKQFVEELAAG